MRVLLEGSQPLEGAAFVTAESDDGLYRASIPREELVSKGWLAFAEDGQPLGRERGGPLRLVVPQGRTLCWNVKAVAELRLTAEGEPDSVPKDPDH
ncbi:MAG: molybdopterin-dependent oxidoreductase [Actinomycetota bacterium]|nr:molybdopterin-dependent oxidoreductase [Actinomycetota bacterium]